jgi:hypothetical protein
MSFGPRTAWLMRCRRVCTAGLYRSRRFASSAARRTLRAQARIGHRPRGGRVGSSKFAVSAVAALLGTAALVTGIGRASPSSFELVMDGFHSAAGPPERFSFGFRHEGPFVSSAPFCSSGYAVDLELLSGTALRQLECAGGSASITVRKLVLQANSQFTHEEGTWTIVDGTGAYSNLRGKGTYVSDFVSGNPADHITTRFRETWRGVIDFDVTAPEVRILRASARRLRRPKGAYSIRIAFSARDGSDGNAVSYVVSVIGYPAYRSGTTTSGNVSTTLRIRPSARVRRLRLVVAASDPVGNQTRLARQLQLPAHRHR